MAVGYLIQALIGLVISIAFFYAGSSFYAAGLISPMGFGQNTGSALSLGSSLETNYGLTGGADFGLTVAAIGFIVGSAFGVIYFNIATHKSLVDKLTVQICLVALAYAGAYGIMLLPAAVPVQAIGELAWGLNFLWVLVAALIIKAVVSALKKRRDKALLHQQPPDGPHQRHHV